MSISPVPALFPWSAPPDGVSELFQIFFKDPSQKGEHTTSHLKKKTLGQKSFLRWLVRNVSPKVSS